MINAVRKSRTAEMFEGGGESRGKCSTMTRISVESIILAAVENNCGINPFSFNAGRSLGLVVNKT